MRKLLLTASLLAASSTVALAQYSGPSDVQARSDGKYTVTTVKEILDDPKDDMDVELEGRIIRKTSDETYVFQDSTGEISIEIDDDDFPSSDVNEATTVRIQGEVDTHRVKDTDIDVDRVTIVQ